MVVGVVRYDSRNIINNDIVIVKRNSRELKFKVGVSSKTVCKAFGVKFGVVKDVFNNPHTHLKPHMYYFLDDPFYTSYNDRSKYELGMNIYIMNTIVLLLFLNNLLSFLNHLN